MKSFFALVTLLLAAAVQALSSSGSRLLAVLDDVADKASYSKFLGDLEGRGFSITYETPKSESLALFRLGERTYDHVIFFPTKAKGLGPNLTPNILLQFLNAGGNILQTLTAAHAVPSGVTSLLLELDIHLPSDRSGLVVDHFNYDAASAADLHDVLVLPPPSRLRPGVKNLFALDGNDAVLAFPRGVGQALGAGPLLSPVVRAPRTAYSYNPKEQADAVDDVFAAGEQLSLVTTVQARNSARLAVVGSAEMLADAWFDATVKKAGAAAKGAKTANREFAKRISAWTFQELGVLRANWMEHHLNEAGAGNESNPKIYRIKNDVSFAISMSEYSWDSWGPFTVPPNDDLQLEFSMLSPFHRLPLHQMTQDSEATKYMASFTLPDQHGIFNFKVNYKRPFLTNIEEKVTVSVRHMAHDEWPRSYVISGAYPWIAGIGATVTGWLFFVVIFMFSKPKDVSGVKKMQ